MRILSIVGSQRKHGNTSHTVYLLSQKIKNYSHNYEIDSDINTVFLSEHIIRMCKGCRICFNKGEKNCPLKDDLLEIKNKINEADIIILSSPVYVEDVSGLLKNWIDRMAFVCHRPEFPGKSAYVISTSGAGSTKHTLMTMSTALRTWGFSIIGADTFKTGAFMNKDEMKKKYDKRLDKIAGKIVDYYRLSRFLSPGFLALMIFRIQQLYYKKSSEKDSVDYRYWEKMQWLGEKRNYYITVKTNIIKVFFARVSGSIIAKFVLK
ncbi:MAG: flavodoxin family protein [Spirochaetales bacterium]|nr:flavodoxin family protein [Spirochaetales bacterium]